MDGELEQRDGRWQLRFERVLPHPPDAVWRALTEPEQLAAWFPAAIEGERVAGAVLRFVFPGGEGPTIDGAMISYEPPSLLEFSWGEDTLRFSLRPAGEGCVLTFINTFDELGKAARDAAGWHVCLDALGYQLDGKQNPLPPRQRWEQVHTLYVKLFGPEAATIGPPSAPAERA